MINAQQLTKQIHRHLVHRAIKGDMDGVDMNGFDMTAIEKIINNALEKDKRDNPIVGDWCVDDVLQQAKQDRIKLTRKEARAVVVFMQRKNEAPVDWDVVSDFIKRYKEEQ